MVPKWLSSGPEQGRHIWRVVWIPFQLQGRIFMMNVMRMEVHE